MTDKQIVITSTMRGNGFDNLARTLGDIEARVNRITDKMASWGATPSGGASGGAGTSAHPQRGRSSGGAAGTGNGQYNLNTPSGLINWDENVLQEALPAMQTIGKGFGSSQMVQQVRQRARRSSVQGGQNSSALGQALGENSRSNQPGASSAPQSLWQHFANGARKSAGKGGIGGFISGGIKGAVMGGGIDMLAGGGSAGSMLGSLGAGVMAAGDSIPGIGLAIAGFQAIAAIGSQIGQGMTTFKQTIPIFSQMSHAIDNASNSAIGFQQNVQMAGARVAMTNIQATQTAQTLMGVFGTSVSQSGYATLTQQTGMAALTNGLTPSQQTQLVAGAAGLGITNGRGSTLTPQQYNEMFLNSVAQSHMQGRQGALGTGLLSVYSGLGSVNPIIGNPLGTAAQYTAMNASGIQGLQGLRGAQLMTQMNSALASSSGVSQMMGMAAIYKASGGKITNPFQMKSILDQGTSAKIGNTTLGAALASMATGMSSNKYTQAGIFSSIMGLSENQSLSVLGSHALNAKTISDINNQYTRMTSSDITTAGSATAQLLGSKLAAARNEANKYLSEGVGIANGFYASGKINTIYSGHGNAKNPKGTAVTNAVGGSFYGGSGGGTISYNGGAAYSGPLSSIMLGIMHQESHGHIYAINDNSTGTPGYGTAYYPKTKAAYMALANKLIAEHHQLALGPYQQEMGNAGVTVANAVNIPYATKTATALLLKKYAASGGSLSQALEAYSGGSKGYAQAVESYAQSINNGSNTSPLNLSHATIAAIGNAVAYALRQKGAVR